MRGKNVSTWAPYAKDPPKSRLPRLPRGVFLALLFSAYPLIKGWCSVFLSQHTLFTLVYVCCGVSTGAWLLLSAITELDAPPLWLKIWSGANLAIFLLLMATALHALARLPTP